MNSTTQSSPPLRVLIIDDDEDDYGIIRDLIQEIPEQRFQIDWCSDYHLGIIALRESLHDIYLVDYYLGPQTGIDFIKEAQLQGFREPMILLTGQGNTKIDMDAVRFGAADYLIKSQLTSEQIDRCIRYSLQRASTLRETRTSERKFRAIFERSTDAIFIADSNLNFQLVNTATTDLFGYELEELLQMELSQLFVSSHERENIIETLNQQRELVDYKIEFLTKDKVRKNCVLSASFETDPIANDYVQGIIHDISVLKRVEEIRLRSEKLEARGMLIKTLAHEVRNPLHNIILSTTFLKGETAHENQEFLDVIDRNSKRINEIINELMDSNQYQKMKLEVISLVEVVQQAIHNAEDRIRLSNMKLHYHHPITSPWALLDREKIVTALLNIIVNSIEAMEVNNGVLTITITTNSDTSIVEIKDNGCGMTNENMERLFEPYFTTKLKGMGLGLAATREILKLHDAQITLTSVMEEGTSFCIAFPTV